MLRVLGLLIMIALVVMGGAVALDEANRTGGTDETVINESFDPTGGAVEEFSFSNKERTYYNRTPLVEAGGTDVQSDGNYTWYSDNGTLKVVTDSYLDNQSTATIDVAYATASQTQNQLATTFGHLMRSGQLFILPLAAVLLLLGARFLGGM